MMVVLRGDLIRCVVLGDERVGKTSLLMNYATNRFPSKHVPRLFDNYAASIEVAGKRYNLQLIDTTDQGMSDAERRLSYPGTDVFVVCFSVINPETYVHVRDRWIPEIQRHMGDTPYILVGTQVDLRDDPTVIHDLGARGQKPVSFREAASFSRRAGSASYVECSPVMKKRIRRVMNDAFNSVFCPKTDKFGSGCVIL